MVAHRDDERLWRQALTRYVGLPGSTRRLQSARQLADFEPMLPDLRCQFDTTDRDFWRVEALESEQHFPESVLDPSVLMLNRLVLAFV